jgi:oligopeptide transport system permease protein
MNDERDTPPDEEPIPSAAEPSAEPTSRDSEYRSERSAAKEKSDARKELVELAEHWSEERLNLRDAGAAIDQRSLWGDALRRFSHNRIAMLAVLILGAMVVLAIVVPSKERQADAHKVVFSMKGMSPSLKCIQPPKDSGKTICRHPFGTDDYGRDEWVRAWYGARISLSIAFWVAAVILIVGLIYGATSGYFGGRVDNVMMRFLDSLYGLPYLPFAIIFVAVVRAKFPHINPLAYMVPALTITAWFTAARIIRGQVLSLRENDYVESAKSMGAPWYRVLFRHVVPNTIGVMIIAIFLEIPNAILGEAGLSFLGLGVQLPDSSWGLMANEGFKIHSAYPHLMLVPGFLIAITVLCAIAIADGLRDALDPKYIDS